ncbi:flagellar motor switch protein FliM [Fodinisporobacter ferrooxydans]|uniref:Flagellar motor switch protein FliM n=1 Tax=Fodinisporobacter ferrooxydans TaxID=2901836 RepID=A0ABY4CFR4_9BACL|nr:flagellar motor switch protein FliM [Alicyclobacillaceae bacterium MYW30-H2]
MAEVLSQAEIDALLSALSSGELIADDIRKDETERKVRVYDFKRAMRFSKDQVRSMTRIFENYGRFLTSYFSAQLRTYVEIDVASVDQLPYEEFIRSIPKMTILNIFNIHPLEGKFVMEINPNVAFAMLDRLMGGTGNLMETSRSLTEIETSVMEQIFHRALDSFRDAWKDIIDFLPELDVIEENPQFMQLVSPNETVAVVTLSVKIGEITGMINFCMPHVVLEPIIPKLSVHYFVDQQKSKRERPEDQETIKKQLNRAFVTVSAELGHTRIQVRELLELSVGDVITLDDSIDDRIKLFVGGKQKFFGQPGLYKGKVAMQITSVIDEEGGLDE